MLSARPDGCWQTKRSRVCASSASAATLSGRCSAPFRHKGRTVPPATLAIFDATIASEQTIIGRVIEKGLHDELRGSAYLVLDGVDGRAHYLRVGSIEGVSDVSEDT